MARRQMYILKIGILAAFHSTKKPSSASWSGARRNQTRIHDIMTAEDFWAVSARARYRLTAFVILVM